MSLNNAQKGHNHNFDQTVKMILLLRGLKMSPAEDITIQQEFDFDVPENLVYKLSKQRFRTQVEHAKTFYRIVKKCNTCNETYQSIDLSRIT